MTRRTPADLILVYADAEIPWGQLRVRERGNHNGHMALRPISEVLRTQEIRRIRLGVGEAENRRHRDGYLRRVTIAERVVLQPLFAWVHEALAFLIDGRAEKAMSIYNGRALPATVSAEASASTA